ncbi:MAG: hypothetical protein IPN76_23625 [Saprospiraceae bacterium]|nr:hypothetical protein [Saprospiraceae bacterium]
MLIIKFLFPFFFSFPQGQVGAADHEFKMSVTEVVYVEEKKAFEVKVYLFTDDLTATLTGDPNAALPASKTIGDYVLKHLKLSVNDGKQVLTFQSIRQKNDQVLATFSTPVFTQKIKKINVKNSLLIEKFKEQTNMVYALLPGKGRETELLNAGDVEGEFSF